MIVLPSHRLLGLVPATLLLGCSCLNATESWTEENTPSTFDLGGVVAARLAPPNTTPRSSFFIAGQAGIWRGDLPLAGSWERVLIDDTEHYRAIVQVAGQVNRVEAVGDDGRVATTIEGDTGTWTTADIAGAGNFTGLAVRNAGINSLVVAVSDNGGIYTGGSVTNLSLRQTFAGITWHDVTFGGTIWVAVGSDSNVATSTDGSNWQLHSGELTDGQALVDFHGVAYGPPFYKGGFFTAVGADATISTSVDGVNWTVRQTIPNSPRLFRTVAFVARHAAWVAFGDGTLGEISHDGGNNWGLINETFPQGMNGVAFGLGHTVAVGDGGRVRTSITRLNPDPTSLPTFPPEGDSVTITLSNSSNSARRRASVASGEDFISVTPEFGTGNSPSSFTITVDPFGTTTTRTGLVMLNDIPFPIVQSGEGDPLPVTTLTATAISDRAVALEWPPAAGATDYEILRREISEPVENYAPVGIAPGAETANLITHTDRNDLQSNTTYCYQVVALNGVHRQGCVYDELGRCYEVLFESEIGRADSPSPEACTTTLLAGAEVFGGRVVGELDGISLFWAPVSGAGSHQLERRRQGTTDVWDLIANLPANARDYLDDFAVGPDALEYLHGYTYRLTGVGAVGAIPATTTVLTTPLPIIDASVNAVDIPDLGALEGAFDITFSREDFLNAEVETRVEPGGPWQALNRFTDPLISVTSDPPNLGILTETWRYSQPAATRSFRVRTTSTGFPPSSWVELGPVSTPPPIDPTGFTLTERTANSGTFSWTNGSDEEAYEVVVRPASAIDDSQDIVVTLAPDTTTATIGGLFPGTSYDAFLIALGVEGINATSRSTQGVGSATLTFSTLPSGPFPVTATADNPNSVTVNWGSVSGATGYEVWRSDFFAGGFQPYVLLTSTGSGSLSTNDTTVAGGNTYRYQVRAAIGGDFTSFRESNIVGTPAGAPTIVSATALGANEIEVDWTDPNAFDPISYKVEYSTSSTGPWTSKTISGIFPNPPPTITSVSGLDSNTLYFFRVTAIYLFGNTSPPSALASETTLRGLRFLTATSSIAFIEFDEFPDTDVYFFERSLSGPTGSFSGAGSINEDGFTRTFLATGLIASRTYHFRMRPFLDSGSFGPYTDVVEANTAPLTPALNGDLLVFSGSPRAHLTWTIGSDSDKVTVYRRPGNTGAFVEIGETTATLYNDFDLHPGDNQYQIYANYNGQRSAESNIVTVTLNASSEQQWRFDNFGTVQDSGDAADSSDPDEDGFDNAAERDACTDPNDGNVFPLPPLPNGLVAHWPLDDPLDPGIDVTGNGHHGALSGSVTQQPGANGNTGSSLEFNGASVIKVPWCGTLNPPSFTVTLWANPSVAGGGEYRSPFTNRDFGGGGRHGMMLYNNNSGIWSFWSGDPDVGTWQTMNGPAVITNVWIHLAIVYDAATQTKKLYVNGSPAASNTAANQYEPNGPDMEDLHIGAGGDAGAEFRFSGKIDDVALFSTALSEADINTIKDKGVTGFLAAPLRLTLTSFEPGTQAVTLRWKDNGVPYRVIGSDNLLFGEIVDEVLDVNSSNGTMDTTTFPGDIEFQFIDPGATGPARFWKVNEAD